MTSWCVPVASCHHSMIVKEGMSLWHCTNYLFESCSSSECLLCHWCVKSWTRLPHWFSWVFFTTLWSFVVSHMQVINNLVDVQPYSVVWTLNWQWCSCNFHGVYIAHIVIRECKVLSTSQELYSQALPSDLPITQQSATYWVSVVCLKHDTLIHSNDEIKARFQVINLINYQ